MKSEYQEETEKPSKMIDLKLGPSLCEATVLTTTAACSPGLQAIQGNYQVIPKGNTVL